MKRITGLLIILFLWSILDIISTYFALFYFGLFETNGMVAWLYAISPIMIFIFPFIVILSCIILIKILNTLDLELEGRIIIILFILSTIYAVSNNIGWMMV